MAEVTPTERVSAEQLLDEFGSYDLKWKSKRWKSLRTELLSRLSEVEELRKQVEAAQKENEFAGGLAATLLIRAQDAESRAETLSKRLSKMEGALREAMPMIEFYAEREINHPANHQEFVREKREMLRELRAVLAESALSLPPSEEEPPQKETK